ncbi:hypothetical protein [Polymorphobacter sp.]|uniref:hypothetical protein n=1 Tax=Polymorphobacter sp. TaxID=1909290 RepID=UPI003F723525
MHYPFPSKPVDAQAEVAITAAPDLVAMFWQALKARWALIALVMAGSLVMAIAYLRTADYVYLAEMRVAAAPGSENRAPRLGSLSGLAALAGVGLETEATPFRLYLEDLHSSRSAAALARDRPLMHRIFEDEWTGTGWMPHPSLADRATAAILGLAGASVPAWQAPDAARLQTWLASNIGINEDPQSPVVTLTVVHRDPAFAKALLERLHQVADDRARARALARAGGNIAHLDARLQQVTALDHRQAMFATRAAEEQRLMLARNPTPFATQRFGAATVTADPVSPRQGIILIGALVLGLVGGCILALLLGPPRDRTFVQR